jgi:hypothetical protein
MTDSKSSSSTGAAAKEWPDGSLDAFALRARVLKKK